MAGTDRWDGTTQTGFVLQLGRRPGAIRAGTWCQAHIGGTMLVESRGYFVANMAASGASVSVRPVWPKFTLRIARSEICTRTKGHDYLAAGHIVQAALRQ